MTYVKNTIWIVAKLRVDLSKSQKLYAIAANKVYAKMR